MLQNGFHRMLQEFINDCTALTCELIQTPTLAPLFMNVHQMIKETLRVKMQSEDNFSVLKPQVLFKSYVETVKKRKKSSLLLIQLKIHSSLIGLRNEVLRFFLSRA